jgi:hypothetical protein
LIYFDSHVNGIYSRQRMPLAPRFHFATASYARDLRSSPALPSVNPALLTLRRLGASPLPKALAHAALRGALKPPFRTLLLQQNAILSGGVRALWLALTQRGDGDAARGGPPERCAALELLSVRQNRATPECVAALSPCPLYFQA